MFSYKCKSLINTTGTIILPHLKYTIEQVKSENMLIAEKLNFFPKGILSDADFYYYQDRLRSLADGNNQYLDYLDKFYGSYSAFQTSTDYKLDHHSAK